MKTGGQPSATDWSSRTVKGRVSFQSIIWSYIVPKRGHQTTPTVVGLVVSVLAVGVGCAAYFAGSNILFMTLSLLLASLVLSGVLSGVNFFGVQWRLVTDHVLRVDQTATLTVEARNKKRRLPAYALWFDVEAMRSDVRTRLRQVCRLDAGEILPLSWTFTPRHRGHERLKLLAVISHFPFGFLRKTVDANLHVDVRVWPRRVSYQLEGTSLTQAFREDRAIGRKGFGAEFLGLREYVPGDPQRHIHWRASARNGGLLVRQNAADSADAYALRIDTDAEAWTRSEQFELLCSFVASLAEDLFRAGKLKSWCINGGEVVRVRQVRDLDALLDALSVIEIKDIEAARFERSSTSGAVIRFAPEGERSVCATVSGEIVARA